MVRCPGCNPINRNKRGFRHSRQCGVCRDTEVVPEDVATRWYNAEEAKLTVDFSDTRKHPGLDELERRLFDE